MSQGLNLDSSGKLQLDVNGFRQYGKTGDPCCCPPCAKHCYQRWTYGFDCDSQTTTGDPIAHEFVCWTPVEAAGKASWYRVANTSTVCNYEIYVQGPCCDTTSCDGLPDTTAPLAPNGSDCAPICGCCVPPGTVLTVAVDSTAMIPTVPIDTPDGTWHTITPVAPGDWHFYMGSTEWIAHPQTIFVGGGPMAYPVNPFVGGGVAAYFDCSVTPDTQPTGQGGLGTPYTNFGNAGAGFPCGWQIGTFNYGIYLSCNGMDNTYTVGALGFSNDDLFTGLPGFYQYFGSNNAVTLDCVDGRPVGTVVINMQWSVGDINFGPSSPYGCGTLTVTIS